MAPGKRSPVWYHFTDLSSGKVQCIHCPQVLSTQNGCVGNLSRHMKSKHRDIPFKTEDGGGIIYEYVTESPKSSRSGSDDESKTARTKSPPKIWRRISVAEQHQMNAKTEKPKDRKLIEQLTEEKLNVTVLQKELVEKELEEKRIRFELLQAEMEHKKEMYELEKQEMLLRIETLQNNLEKSKQSTSSKELSGLD